ncbi:MAG TPA: sulfatase, partial [Planctomycetota bacterium]|nr:sulfatase [Planctomycetota bacterium]
MTDARGPIARCAAAVALLAACAPPSPREQLVAASGWAAPVVLVVVDTLRLDHTSLGGCERDTTPFLAELARRAVVFDAARAQSSWTRPSMASLFTSRLPAGHGCEGRLGRVAESVPLLPELLHEAGYDARAVQANGNLAAVYGFDRGFSDYRCLKGRPLLPYADAAFLRGFVENTARALQPPPFFLYLHYVDPHDPYLLHPEHDWNPAYAGTFDGTERSLQPFRLRRPSAANLARTVDLYDGEIAWVDDQLRSLFGFLSAQGTLEHAWIVITSDHGEGLWQHRIQGHADELYEEQLRVPLLLLPPGGLDRPLHVPEPFPLMDLAPTLLDLLGLPPCESFAGRSWAPHRRRRARDGVDGCARRRRAGGGASVARAAGGAGSRARPSAGTRGAPAGRGPGRRAHAAPGARLRARRQVDCARTPRAGDRHEQEEGSVVRRGPRAPARDPARGGERRRGRGPA